MPTSGLAAGPSWSRDGQYLAWDQWVEGQGVWVAHRDSLIPRRVLPYPGYPTWDPTRLAILYLTVNVRGTSTTFHEYDLATNTVTTLFSLSGEVREIREPRYAPDGEHLVFTVIGQLDQGVSIDVYSCNRTGGDFHRLTFGGGAEAAFDPAGGRLAYIRLDPFSIDPHKNTLWAYEFSSGASHELVTAWPASCDTVTTALSGSMEPLRSAPPTRAARNREAVLSQRVRP